MLLVKSQLNITSTPIEIITAKLIEVIKSMMLLFKNYYITVIIVLPNSKYNKLCLVITVYGLKYFGYK